MTPMITLFQGAAYNIQYSILISSLPSYYFAGVTFGLGCDIIAVHTDTISSLNTQYIMVFSTSKIDSPLLVGWQYSSPPGAFTSGQRSMVLDSVGNLYVASSLTTEPTEGFRLFNL